jgi:YfiH family protein
VSTHFFVLSFVVLIPTGYFRAAARGIAYVQVDDHAESSPDSSQVEILRPWPDASICHGFIGRAGGVSTGAFASMNLSYWVGDDERAVDTNWQRLRREVPELEIVARLNQVHGNVVHAATRDTAALRPPGDGIVTAEPGVMLGIFSADCVPILLIDSKRKVAGALHAGWRGVIAEIADAGVRAMLHLGARASDIRAAMGPSIGQCCFEVDAPARPSSICAPSSAISSSAPDSLLQMSRTPARALGAPPIAFSRAAPPAA